MNVRCVRCNVAFKDSEVIKVTVVTRFKSIPSRVAFALCKPMDYDEDTLVHMECPLEE